MNDRPAFARLATFDAGTYLYTEAVTPVLENAEVDRGWIARNLGDRSLVRQMRMVSMRFHAH
jgi:hypothetical protein